MKLSFVILATSLVVLMLVVSCSDSSNYDSAPSIYGSMNSDGTNQRTDDMRLDGNGMKTYYLADSLVVFLGSAIYTRSLNSLQMVPITPSNITVISESEAAISLSKNRIFFCGYESQNINERDVFSCALDGSDLINHTVDITSQISNPALSYDDEYITGVSENRILRGHLDTAVIDEVVLPHNPTYAIYHPEHDTYYYIARNYMLYGYYDLYKYANGMSTYLTGDYYPGQILGFGYGGNTVWCYSQGSLHNLYYIDVQTDQIKTLGTAYACAISKSENAIFASFMQYGVADIRKYNPETDSYSLFHDGIFDRITYRSRMTRIMLREDGQRFHYVGTQGTRR